MCGIFGYIGDKNPLLSCLEGLKKLEYRGYDSAGIAGIRQNKIVCLKKLGKISALEKKLDLQDPKTLKLDIAIGHTRWATHGKPNEANAHPHQDQNSTLALVHNGIIENYDEIKTNLMNKNVKFSSETDSEVIAQLIAYNYEGDLLTAVHKSLSQLKGSFAIALIHKNHPENILVACKESPLAIGFNDDQTEVLISSDPNAFLGYNLNVFYLQNNETALLSSKSIRTYDSNRNLINKKTEKLQGENKFPHKNGFKHFMLKEIHEQPLTVQKAMLGRISETGEINLFNELNFSKEDLLSIDQILIIACGSSWHAGKIAALMLENYAKIQTKVEIASEIRFTDPLISEKTLVIAISQSGETADTIGALRDAKIKKPKTLGICNVKNSTLARETDSSLFLNAGPEISVCSTKAFTSQITLLYIFSLFMAQLKNINMERNKIFLKEMKKLPTILNYILKNSDKIQELALKYSKYDNFFFLGKRYMYPTCMEAALKLKEISYLNANAYPAGEMKHGPIALISSKLPVIAFCSDKTTYEKTLSNLMETKARGAPILAFASFGSTEVIKIANDIIWLPQTIDELSIFPTTIASQLFAYFIADNKGREIDRPRNLAKSVTVE